MKPRRPVIPTLAAKLQRAGIATALSACLAAGCIAGWGFVYDSQIVGLYHLVAVDSMDQMTICIRSDPTKGHCSGPSLEATVFQAGGDEQYVVFASHPLTMMETTVCVRSDSVCNSAAFPEFKPSETGENHRYVSRSGPPDKTVTEHYYVIREPGDHQFGKVVGPFDAVTFEAESKRLHLPAFSIVIEELR